MNRLSQNLYTAASVIISAVVRRQEVLSSAGKQLGGSIF